VAGRERSPRLVCAGFFLETLLTAKTRTNYCGLGELLQNFYKTSVDTHFQLTYPLSQLIISFN
jgi:hypothetical protein